MKPYIRYQPVLTRRIPESRYPQIHACIGYLYRSYGGILSRLWRLTDSECTDGAYLRIPKKTFSSVYYEEFLPELKNDASQEMLAVYFDPYAGRFFCVGSKRLFSDALDRIGKCGTPVFLDGVSPFHFDAAAYGICQLPEPHTLSFDDFRLPDITGQTLEAVMVQPDAAGRNTRYALYYLSAFWNSLKAGVADDAPDRLTTLLAGAVFAGNASLLACAFTLNPALADRFRPTLREKDKLSDAPLPDGYAGAPVLNLFHYTMLCGDPDVTETLFRFYPRPAELEEFLHHPTFYGIGFHLLKSGNLAALCFLLDHDYAPNATDQNSGRISVLSYACLLDHPAAVAVLCKAGADIFRTDDRRQTAVDICIEENRPCCLLALLSAMPQEKAAETAEQYAATLAVNDENQPLLQILARFSPALARFVST